MFDNIPAELLWFVFGFALLMAELAIPAFIVVFFGIGAWLTSLTTLLGFTQGTASQLIVFVAVSLVTLVLFRKKAKGLGRGHVSVKSHEAHGTDSFIGSSATVTEDIEPNVRGKVELFGTSWQATANTVIKKGTVVEIITRENLTLKVKVKGE